MEKEKEVWKLEEQEWWKRYSAQMNGTQKTSVEADEAACTYWKNADRFPFAGSWITPLPADSGIGSGSSVSGFLAGSGMTGSWMGSGSGSWAGSNQNICTLWQMMGGPIIGVPGTMTGQTGSGSGMFGSWAGSGSGMFGSWAGSGSSMFGSWAGSGSYAPYLFGGSWAGSGSYAPMCGMPIPCETASGNCCTLYLKNTAHIYFGEYLNGGNTATDSGDSMHVMGYGLGLV